MYLSHLTPFFIQRLVNIAHISLRMNRKAYITCNFNCYNEAKAHMKVTGRKYAEKMLSPVYTIQPLVKPVVRFDNRLYRVCKHSTGCQTRLTTGLRTGWMFVYTMTTDCIV